MRPQTIHRQSGSRAATAHNPAWSRHGRAWRQTRTQPPRLPQQQPRSRSRTCSFKSGGHPRDRRHHVQARKNQHPCLEHVLRSDHPVPAGKRGGVRMLRRGQAVSVVGFLSGGGARHCRRESQPLGLADVPPMHTRCPQARAWAAGGLERVPVSATPTALRGRMTHASPRRQPSRSC